MIKIRIDINIDDEKIIRLFDYLKLKYNFKQNTDVLTMIIYNYVRSLNIPEELKQDIFNSETMIKIRKRIIKDFIKLSVDLIEDKELRKNVVLEK